MKELWRSKFAITSLVTDPELFNSGRRKFFLNFSIDEEGEIKKINLAFIDVHAYKCTFLPLLISEMVKLSYGKVIQIEPSKWLAEIEQNKSERLEKNDNLLHLMITFDEGPCYEFICTAFEVSE